jgi:hypothetical protein
VRVWALIVDVSDKDKPGEADRDQLA